MRSWAEEAVKMSNHPLAVLLAGFLTSGCGESDGMWNLGGMNKVPQDVIEIIPIMIILCVASAWLFVRSSNSKTSTTSYSVADGQRRQVGPLTKGFLYFLGAIGWTGGVAVAARSGIIPSNANTILWSLVPALILLVVGAVYLLRGFSGDLDNGAE